jgi:hypothetical protein
VTRRIRLDQVADAFTALESPGEQAKIIVEPARG